MLKFVVLLEQHSSEHLFILIAILFNLLHLYFAHMHLLRGRLMLLDFVHCQKGGEIRKNCLPQGLREKIYIFGERCTLWGGVHLHCNFCLGFWRWHDCVELLPCLGNRELFSCLFGFASLEWPRTLLILQFLVIWVSCQFFASCCWQCTHQGGDCGPLFSFGDAWLINTCAFGGLIGA